MTYNPRDMFREMISVWEGGFVNDPHDRGGATNMGVTIETARKLGLDLDADGDVDVADLKLMTLDLAAEIGERHYYFGPGLSRLPWCPAIAIWTDIAWGSGPVLAVRAMQRAIGAKPDAWIGEETFAKFMQSMMEHGQKALADEAYEWRIAFYKRICQRDETQYRFLNGWTNRANYFSSKNKAWWQKWGIADA